MEKKMFKTGTAGTIVTCIILIIMTAGFGVLTFNVLRIALYGTEISEADSYDEFVYMDVLYISQPFASDDSNEYLFATIKKGDTYYDYMICVPESYFGSDEIQNKINYTYTEGAEDSGPLRIRGFLRRSFEELDNTAKETYPLYANLEENEDAADYLGTVYLEYASSGNNLANIGVGTWIAIVAMLMLMIVWIVEFVRLIIRQNRKNKKIAAAKNMYATDIDYQNGVRQTTEPDAQFFKSCRCYVTREYVVSYQEGLEVFRIDQLRELYGYDKQRYHAIMNFLFGAFAGFSMEHSLVAITADGVAHKFASLGAALKTHNVIAAAMLGKNANVRLGRQGVYPYTVCPSPDQLNLAKIPGFYGSDDIWTGRTVNSLGV